MNRFAVGCLAVCVLVAAGLGGTVIVLFVRFDSAMRQHTTVREFAAVPLPNGSGELRYSRIGIHPFQAEYSRDVRLTVGGREVVLPLIMNTGGREHINVYWLSSPSGDFVRLDDAFGDHLFDVGDAAAYLIVNAKGKRYVGYLGDERAGQGWSQVDGKPESLRVSVGDNQAVPLNELTDAYPGTFLGTLTGGTGNLRFIPAAELPEQAIEKLFPEELPDLVGCRRRRGIRDREPQTRSSGRSGSSRAGRSSETKQSSAAARWKFYGSLKRTESQAVDESVALRA